PRTCRVFVLSGTTLQRGDGVDDAAGGGAEEDRLHRGGGRCAALGLDDVRRQAADEGRGERRADPIGEAFGGHERVADDAEGAVAAVGGATVVRGNAGRAVVPRIAVAAGGAQIAFIAIARARRALVA